MKRGLHRIVPLLGIALGACGGGPSDDWVSISGSTLPMLPHTLREFNAEVHWPNSQAVTWSLQEGAAAGTISSTGRYTAGATPGTYHVIATSNDNPDLTATVPVTVKGFGSPAPFGFGAYGVAVSATGMIAMADNWTTVRFLTTAPGDSVTVGGTPVHVVYSPNGNVAYTGLQTDQKLVRMQVSPAQELGRVTFGHSIYNLAAHPNGSSLFVTTADGWLFRVNASSLAKQDSVKLASASNGLAFNANASKLFVSTISAGWLYAIDPATLAKSDSFDVGAGAQRVAVAPSGDSVYVANESAGGVNIVQVSTGTVTTKLMDGTPYGIALSADGAALYVALRSSGNVRILGRTALDSLTTIVVGGTPRNVAVDPTGNFVVVTTESDLVKIQ